MKRNIYLIMIAGLISACILQSCNAWLDIKPNDKVLEEEMFSSQKGFLTALNGVYINLMNSSLYGSDLSAGMVDVMAQYYKVRGNNNHVYRLYANYNYDDEASKTKIDNIWSKAYKTIYDINVIIEKCELDKSVLSESNRNLIMGEAYALRAMLHLDLLRLFGPIYANNKDKECIPYQKNTDFRIEPLLTAQEVLENVIKDLKAAEICLANDPVKTDGPSYISTENSSVDLLYRQFRLNYFAVKGLLARAYLWGGYNREALEYAKAVVAESQSQAKPLFPFVSYDKAMSTTTPDRVFSTEILFSMYNSKRGDLYSSLFSPSLASSSILTMFPERIESMYDDDNDIRKKSWGVESVESDAVNFYKKYAEITSSDNQTFNVGVRYTMPLVRVSEMHLIIAECSTNLEESTKHLNLVRNARNCISVNPSQEMLRSYITSEYVREFIGEGQLFYYYKRNAFQNLPNGGDPHTTFNMDLSNYILPLPESEISQRNN